MALGTDNCYPLIPGGVMVASGDFTNIATSNAADGVYTLNGSPAALEDIFDLDYPDSNFNPATMIDSGGITPRPTGSDTALYLQSALVTQLLSGYSALFEVVFANGLTTFNANLFDSPDYNFQSGLAISRDSTVPYEVVQLQAVDDSTADGAIGSDGLHKIAMTVTDARLACSIDGGTVFAVESAGIDPTHNAFYFNIGGVPEVARLRSFAFYEVVDDTDLQALSA